VLASIGTVGDAYDNALAESFVDSYKTELIADRVWRTRAQLELATVQWVAWFNHDRLHEALGDIPPVEFEQNHALQRALESPIPGNRSVTAIVSKPADRLTTRRVPTAGVDLEVNRPIAPEIAPAARRPLRSGRDNSSQRTNGRGWPLRPVVSDHSLTN
jgi:Integrase core domain